MNVMRHLLLIIAFLSTSLAFSQTEINGINYFLDATDNTASVTSKIECYSGEITIPETVTYDDTTYTITSIGGNAFFNCASLTAITLPNTLTSIEGNAFSDCSSLSSITLPNSVTSIAGYAFYDCPSLTSITLPNSITSIGDAAFGYCTSLTSVTLPNSITSIGAGTFSGCSSLTSINLPNSITSIGNSAFDGTSLPSITLPNSLTSIGLGAFYNCTALTSITLPNTLTSIGDYAFGLCTALTSVTALNPTPVAINSINADVFLDVPITTIPLYVADEAAVTAYQATAVWQDFNSVTAITTSIEDSEFANKIVVYPNPFSDFITFDLPTIQGQILLELFDNQGRLIFYKIIQNGEKLDMSFLDNGTYIYNLIDEENTKMVGRLIKK